MGSNHTNPQNGGYNRYIYIYLFISIYIEPVIGFNYCFQSWLKWIGTSIITITTNQFTTMFTNLLPSGTSSGPNCLEHVSPKQDILVSSLVKHGFMGYC